MQEAKNRGLKTRLIHKSCTIWMSKRSPLFADQNAASNLSAAYIAQNQMVIQTPLSSTYTIL